jgi:hypothetical protein
MVILLAIVAGLVWWVAAWGLGVKSFDALMLTMLIALVAVGWHMIRPFLPGYRENPDDPGSGRSWIGR